MITEKSQICWCPACDEGWVHQITVKNHNINGSLCQECEALWLGDDVITDDDFWQLSSYIKQQLSNKTEPIIKKIWLDADGKPCEEDW